MSEAVALEGGGVARAPKRGQFSWKAATPYLLIAPVIIYYIFFWLRPVVELVIGSFTAVEGGFTLQNFGLVLQDPTFWPAVRNTTIIVVFSVALEFVVAFLLALLINEKFPGASAFLFVAMLPMALPAMAVAAMWQTGLTSHGWINSLLYYMGFLEEGQKIYFLTGSDLKNLFLIIFVDAWTVIPSVMIILLAGLQNLPEEAKEAGYVFGGTWWTVLRKIIVPMVKPTIQTAVILRLIAAIQIWLIIVMLFGFNRLPVLVERIVYYTDEVPGLYNSYQMAASYTIVVSLVVSIAAIAFLQVTGAFRKQAEDV
ncbi:MAG: sugar ABC transporter permease [Chloroflexota bacterium]|nr:sugar ABC transporter permease [Chloroflexota bacterium]